MLRAQKIEISPEKIADLTYDFDATSVYWPNAKSFDWQPIAHGNERTWPRETVS